MKKIGIFNLLIELKRTFIEGLTPNMMKNHDGKCFTRKRGLTLATMMMILLRCSPFALQIRLDDFFKGIGQKEATVSKQAFSKARTNLDPNLVKMSFQQTVEVLSSAEDLELFKGKFRLCAIDGSDVILPNSAEILEHFGGCGRNKDCATALASVCYDTMNNIILDANLSPYGTGERAAARLHFDEVGKLPLPKKAKNLYIFDRGYPSKELFAEMIDKNLHFLMRVKKKFSCDFDLVTKKEKITFLHNGKEYKVRVFNITLDSGEKEILVTTLPKKYVRRSEIGDLYFQRWAIEEKFKSLKSKLQLENFSGMRSITIYQDFWAKLDLANTTAALQWATDEVIEDNANPENKHSQTTNEGRLVHEFSEAYLELMTVEDDDERLALFDELVADISRRPEQVRTGRKSSRKTPRKKRFNNANKPYLT